MKPGKGLASKLRPAKPDRSAEFASFQSKPRAAACAIPDGKARMCVPIKKANPVRDEGYQRLIAKMDCIACGRSGRSQAAHGPTLGKSIKASDADLFPLCADEPLARGCHWRFDNYTDRTAHQRREVAAMYIDDARAEARRLASVNPKVRKVVERVLGPVDQLNCNALAGQ